MSKFTPHQMPPKKQPGIRIKNEKDEKEIPVEPRVVKLGNDAEKLEVKPFEFGAIATPGEKNYAAVKARYGALAATDPERAGRSTKDSRFKLNPLLRDPLSVEQEERRVIDEKVRERVAAVADEVRAKASTQGYQDGLKKGYQEAYANFQKEGRERLESLSRMIEEFEAAKEQIYHANERFLLEIAYRVGKMVLLRELTTDRDYVLRLARELVERVGVRESVTVHINGKDAETAGMLKDGLEKALGNLQNLNIQVSEQVKLGGCIVETEWNAIDASLETQLQSLASAIFAVPADGNSGSPGSKNA